MQIGSILLYNIDVGGDGTPRHPHSLEVSMLKEIMITEKVVAAWATDAKGVMFITDMVPTDIFGLPADENLEGKTAACLLYTSPSPRDRG